MRIVGVIDLRGGRAVHARGGRRDAYEPVRTAANARIDGDAVRLATTYVRALGLRELYVADLDAIGGARSESNEAIVRSVVTLGASVWLDAGSSSVDAARRALGLGVGHVVVGLETLPSFQVLEEICSVLGSHRVASSIDLRDGQPVALPNVSAAGDTVPAIARRAVGAGAGALIVLDLARVGSDAGIDIELIAGVRAAVPRATVLAGGGVRGAADLEQLAASGCDGVLAATALHDGRIGAGEVVAAQRFPVGRRRSGA